MAPLRRTAFAALDSSMPLPSPDAAGSPDLADRVVLVTGAAGGLGRAVATGCAKAGATVILHGRVVRKLEALYDEIADSGAPEPVIVPLDLAKAEAEDFATIASALESQLGRLDAIIHTAVQLGTLGPVEHQSFDLWLSGLRINVAAPMGLTRALVRLLSKSTDASVTFTLDTRGQAPHAYWGSYAVAKAALNALTTILADEWEKRENLRVNAVVPGPIRSPLRTQTHPGEERDALVPPEALVPLYLHLVSGQTKAESGARIDAQAWVAGESAVTSLLP
jgi:NAD(P)-dependent dehydrogenase (short-subunit alcohol dehydrogenase family)